jgi:hypothetical protein
MQTGLVVDNYDFYLTSTVAERFAVDCKISQLRRRYALSQARFNSQNFEGNRIDFCLTEPLMEDA